MTDATLTFRHLRVDELPKVCKLLVENWPQTYGDTGCPDFSVEYLAWLLGGPSADRHIMLGVFRNEKLIGFKDYLYRSSLHAKTDINVYIATHLTVEQNLPLSERMVVAAEMARLHVFEPDYAAYEPDALLAFFEEAKSLHKSTRLMAERQGLHIDGTLFSHSVLNPLALREAGPPSGTIRRCRPEDASTMAKLLADTGCDFRWTPGADVLWYHVSAAPSSAVFGIESDGRLTDFLACYLLDWLKNGKKTKVGVVEVVASKNSRNLAALMQAAWEHATGNGARGVMMENTSYLSPEILRNAGLMTTPRRMHATLRSKRNDINIGGSFFCDIK
ncbi:hypothetical protein [uncultured Roseobacter sp.]|uniref:hypothetical protein n=1 Tax=uncultured Roseobacter sp. TaxID=114847 RepID=UPI002639C2E5|nr:hypothetical protein [uncultured Roseobacter sp.]